MPPPTKPTKPTISLLFLGAAKRVSLLERFLEAAQRLDCRLDMHAFEADAGFWPISHLARVCAAPRFEAPAFRAALDRYVREQSIDIVIPNMDSATVALAEYRDAGAPASCWCVVSSSTLARAMHSKDAAAALFAHHDLPHPGNTPGRFPKIVKPLLGFGSRGVGYAAGEEELALLLQRSPQALVQDFIEGTETTVDFYVSRAGELMGYVLRDRLQVSDGEVMVCRTRLPQPAEENLLARISGLPGWQGCVTVQYIRERSGGGAPVLIEINPRFGGGSTASIEAGLDMAYYILAEHLGVRPEPMRRSRLLLMSRARRDFFCELDESPAPGEGGT
jgi:carbamoyl-phosphate synthase large subunit